VALVKYKISCKKIYVVSGVGARAGRGDFGIYVANCGFKDPHEIWKGKFDHTGRFCDIMVGCICIGQEFLGYTWYPVIA
jgi:hypothetical protein